MEAFANQQITEGQAQQYLWAAVLRTPNQVPANMATAGLNDAERANARADAHILMQQVHENWEQYAPAEQQGIAQSMARIGVSVPNLRNVTQPGEEADWTEADLNGLAFCRYQQVGTAEAHFDLYDEVEVPAADCARRDAASCRSAVTAEGQISCETRAGRCVPNRYYEKCEAGWLDPAYADQRDEFYETSVRPVQVLQEKLGWPQKRGGLLGKMVLVRSQERDPGTTLAITMLEYSPPLTLFFEGEQSGCSTAPRLSAGSSTAHEIFHVAQYYHRYWIDIPNLESGATWFEDYIEPTWDTEHIHFSRYNCSPGLSITQREYEGARELNVLLSGQEDLLFDWIRNPSGTRGTLAPVDLRAQLAALPLNRREALHTLTEQTYGLTVNATSNDVCPYSASYSWRNTTCIRSPEGENNIEVDIPAGNRPVPIEYEVPGMSWAGRHLNVPPETSELELVLSQTAETRTSLLVGGQPERVIALENGENRFCLRRPSDSNDCACQGIPSDNFISPGDMAVVSTQLNSSAEMVIITATAAMGSTAMPSCWQVISGRGEVGGREMYTLEQGATVRLFHRPEGVPSDWPSCTVVLVENHEQTTYTIPHPLGDEIRCTIQGQTAFPTEMVATEPGEDEEQGTLFAFTNLKPYIEGRQHSCTEGRIGITDQGSPIIGPLGILIIGTDRGEVPTQYQYTAQASGDRLHLVHETQSLDGVPTRFEAELVERPDGQCGFADGVLQRALAVPR